MVQYSSVHQPKNGQPTRHIHFMGIGGHGCSAVSQLAQALGERVSGCERILSDSEITRMVQDAGISVVEGHSPDHLDGVDLLVYVPAAVVFNPNNPEILAARERGIRAITWQELLGEYMRSSLGVSIAASHGKGHTTTMVSLMLVDA